MMMMCVGAFVGLALFVRTDINRLYIKYLFFIYPLLAIDLPASALSASVFDVVTFVFLFIFYKPKKVALRTGKVYRTLFFLLTAVSVIGIINAEIVSQASATAFLQYFSTFCFAAVMLDECLADSSFTENVISAIKVTLVISFIFLACQFVFGPGFSFDRSQNSNVLGGLNIRYPGFFQDPQKYAQFLAICIFLLFIRNNKEKAFPFPALLLLLVASGSLMYTGGRASLGGLAVGLVLAVLFGNKQLRSALVTGAVCLYVFATQFQDSLPMFSRIDSLTDDYEFRYAIWKDAFEIFKSHPAFGIGMENYADYVAVHNPDQAWFADANTYAYFNHPESGYLKFLTEYGIAGFSAIFVLIFLPVIQGFRAYYKTADKNIILLIAAVTSFLVGFYTLYSFDDVRIRILVVALICFIIARSKQLLSDAA